MSVKYAAAQCAFVGRVGNKVPKNPAAPNNSEQKGSTYLLTQWSTVLLEKLTSV
jgi:hypothetical protein